MITTHNGATQINGNIIEILSDLSVIIRSVYESVEEITNSKEIAMESIVDAGRAAFADNMDMELESIKKK